MLQMIAAFFPLISFFTVLFLIIYVRKVPLNTLIIVDRNTHYLKTKRHGFYFLNPTTDKVTTRISTFPISKTYSNYFETHDGKIVTVSFHVKYHATNLDDVTYALASVRRSVDDIMEGSVYWAVNNLSLSDFLNKPVVLTHEIKPYLSSEANELRIIIDDFNLYSVQQIPYGLHVTPFKPHLSSHSSGPIRFH